MFSRIHDEFFTKLEELCEQYNWCYEFNIDSQRYELYPKKLSDILEV